MGRLLCSFGEEGLVFFREVRSENELIPTVCHTILINRTVSEVIQFPISRHAPSFKNSRYATDCDTINAAVITINYLLKTMTFQSDYH